MSRRRFLRGVLAGGAMVSVPLPRLANAMNSNGDGFVDGSALPKRFGMWFFGNGIDPATWHPAGPGGMGDAWSLSAPLSPLAAYKSYLSVLSGFELRTPGAHIEGSAGATTAAEPTPFGAAQLPSIDQLIANQLQATTPFKSLEIGLTRATPAGPQPTLHAVSHQGPSAPLYPEYDPHRLFSRLFGIASAPESERFRRQSVLDTVLSDFNVLKSEVGATDKQRLEAHADGVRDLEQRLSQIGEQACNATAPGADIQADDREEAPAELHDAMSRMLAMSMACDLTRVFSYVFSLPAAHVYYRHLGPEFERSFHEDIVHLVDGIPNGYQLVSQGVQYVMESLAVTLSHFQNISTPTGNLLDEIGILATSEVSSGWDHGMQNHPILVIGKGAGLRGNTHVVSSVGQRNYSDVLLTIAQAYGGQQTSIGLGDARSSITVPELMA
ncbi:MAG: DUF1552 domain-containing protein [Myxococcota bacterium]|nr:DUF1552 domain-containing protein [Myxococcota bacterium]